MGVVTEEYGKSKEGEIEGYTDFQFVKFKGSNVSRASKKKMELSGLHIKQLSPMKLKIKVTRKDGSFRDTEIMYDRNTGFWCFVNLTSSHVCKCRFESQEEAVLDLILLNVSIDEEPTT